MHTEPPDVSLTPACVSHLDMLPPIEDKSQADLLSPQGSTKVEVPPVLASSWGPLTPVLTATHRIFLDVCSGVSRPLSVAMQSHNCDILSFDVLLDSKCDLFDDVIFERLLRICASGIVGYNANSPSCKEYSRLKLRPGGPIAIRTPECLDGRPNLTVTEMQSLQDSNLMLTRCIQLATVTFSGGGHSHVEQPPSAMSWQEPAMQQFLTTCHCSCVVIAACKYGRSWYKSWMFATTLRDLSHLGCICDHPPGSHENIAGVRASSGEYISRQTAEYPAPLCQALSQYIAPVVSKSNLDMSLSEAEASLPTKPIDSPPFARQDGGGLTSQADWSVPPADTVDVFRTLRHNWMSHIIQCKLDRKLLACFARQDPNPPFSTEELLPFRKWLVEFLEAQGVHVDWSIPDDQPMCLHVLHAVQKLLQDKDTALFPYLISGVPTGFDEAILPSQCFPLTSPTADEVPMLSVHFSNWSSAEEHPEEVKPLIDEEVKQGWVMPFDGTLEDAQSHWPVGVAIGKLGLALSDHRPPRLVVDSSICGVNGRCTIPEKSTLPTARDILRSYPLRNHNNPLLGFSLDIKSAHKRIAVQQSHRGLLGFQFQGKLYFYRVCPFGAVFSAHYWARLGGFLLRLFHSLTWLAHAGFLYVDDLFMFQDAKVMPVSAAMISILCQICCIPVSWKKCELGNDITWIGWRWHISTGVVSIPHAKMRKLRDLIHKLHSCEKTSKKYIEQFLGLAMWITQLFPSMRTWLHSLYRDLHAIPATQFSVDPDQWNSTVNCLSDQLVFEKRPSGSAIPIGGRLVQVRHQHVSTLNDVSRCLISDKRIWLRIRDPASSKRRLSVSSLRVIDLFRQWVSEVPPCISIWPKMRWPGICVADAFAAGSKSGIGGVITFPSGMCKWFSLPISLDEFQSLNIPMHEDLQKDISSLETLAQVALLFIVAQFQPGYRMALRVPALSDNSGAESVSNKLFTTTMPLALFLEKLSLLVASSGITFDVSHIPGKSNDIADALSRWDGFSNPPHGLKASDRFDLSLPAIWNIDLRPRLFPPHATIPWSFPS